MQMHKPTWYISAEFRLRLKVDNPYEEFAERLHEVVRYGGPAFSFSAEGCPPEVGVAIYTEAETIDEALTHLPGLFAPIRQIIGPADLVELEVQDSEQMRRELAHDPVWAKTNRPRGLRQLFKRS